MNDVRVVIPKPRRKCLTHSKRMAYCDTCNDRVLVKAK